MAYKTTVKLNGVLTEVTAFDSSAQQIDDAVDAIPVLQAAIAAVIPSGLISMWSGTKDKIPEGWLLCDGSNGTPDLRGRFIVGAGGDYDAGATGGAASVTLSTEEMPSHTHTFTGAEHSHTGSISMSSLECKEAGGHQHKIDKFYDGYDTFTPSGSDQFSPSGGYTAPTMSGSSGNGYFRNSDDTEGTHTHEISGSGSLELNAATAGGSNGNTGEGKAHENRPPYYALCYIMKQ